MNWHQPDCVNSKGFNGIQTVNDSLECSAIAESPDIDFLHVDVFCCNHIIGHNRIIIIVRFRGIVFIATKNEN